MNHRLFSFRTSNSSKDDANRNIRLDFMDRISTYRHNDIYGSGRLPDDVLNEIFMYLSKSWKPEFRVPDASWTRVSAVSRRRRRIALCSPLLWTDINVLRPERASVFLRRSRHAPIHMYANYPVDFSNDDTQILETTNSLLPHLARIVSLELIIASSHDLDMWTSRESGIPFHQLLLIRLEVTTRAETNGVIAPHMPTSDDHLPVPSRRLFFQGTCMEWSSSLYRNLRTLDLKDQSHPSSSIAVGSKI